MIGRYGNSMLRPLPNHGTLWLHIEDDEDDDNIYIYIYIYVLSSITCL